MAVVVRLAGTFRVHAAGAQSIGAGNIGAGNNGPGATEHVIGSPKARRLLALLAARREQVVTPDGLVVALWGDQPPERPARNVATLVSRLRAQLGGRRADRLDTDAGGGRDRGRARHRLARRRRGGARSAGPGPGAGADERHAHGGGGRREGDRRGAGRARPAATLPPRSSGATAAQRR